MNWNKKMEHTYWQKQTKNSPLFPKLIWDKPENKLHAGKLLIVGGNLHAFNAPSMAYAQVIKAGAGTIRLILPISIKKTVQALLPDAEFAPVTPSGSLAKQSLSLLLENETWADGSLLAGDFGKNSETTILLERFMEETTHPTILVGDTIDNLLNTPNFVHKTECIAVLTLSQLQKLAINLKNNKAFTSNMSLINLVESLHEFTSHYKLSIVLVFENNIIVARSGMISTTKMTNNSLTNIVIASIISVWAIQNSDNLYKALSTAVIDCT